MLFVKSDRPVDPIVVATIREVDRATKSLDLPYFLAGAAARDIVLHHVFGLDAGNATSDVDFAIAVKNWEQFKGIKTQLIAQGNFTSDKSKEHRLHYKHANEVSYPLDIIPFRGVENSDRFIAWPPEMAIIMNVTGYEEALDASIKVQIDENTIARVVSLPGLALLKLFAWKDRGIGDPKDALDLATLFRRYPYAGNQDRLYDEEISVLDAVNFDMDLAGPRLLGKDVHKIANQETLKKLLELLAKEKNFNALTVHMSARLIRTGDGISAAERMLNEFILGLKNK